MQQINTRAPQPPSLHPQETGLSPASLGVIRSPWPRHSSHVCPFLICTKSLLPQCVLLPSRVLLSETPRTVARHAPLSMGIFRQEYWSGLPFPPPGDLSGPGIEPASPALAGRFFTTVPPGKPPISAQVLIKTLVLPGYLNLPYQFMSV